MVADLVPSGCRDADPYRCVDRTAYLFDMFLASDTTVALLSDVPNSGPLDAPLPWEAKRETRQLAAGLAGDGAPRVLLHDVIAPNFGDLSMRLDEMAATVGTGDVAAFKVYTAWGPDRQGYALDDPAIGIPVVEQARSLGVNVMCGHKGLPLLEFDRRFNGPRDLVALAAAYPDMQFVVYHGAYQLDRREGPYDVSRADVGIDSLVAALDELAIPPNANVWAELGTTWRETLHDPTEAAHVLGKLLSRVGDRRVLWGTDAVWYGSPQPQIQAFRAFQILPELQERHGYPALTDDLKRRVLGLNAAELFGVDPDEIRCGLDPDALAVAACRARVAGHRRRRRPVATTRPDVAPRRADVAPHHAGAVDAVVVSRRGHRRSRRRRRRRGRPRRRRPPRSTARCRRRPGYMPRSTTTGCVLVTTSGRNSRVDERAEVDPHPPAGLQLEVLGVLDGEQLRSLSASPATRG